MNPEPIREEEAADRNSASVECVDDLYFASEEVRREARRQRERAGTIKAALIALLLGVLIISTWVAYRTWFFPRQWERVGELQFAKRASAALKAKHQGTYEFVADIPVHSGDTVYGQLAGSTFEVTTALNSAPAESRLLRYGEDPMGAALNKDNLSLTLWRGKLQAGDQLNITVLATPTPRANGPLETLAPSSTCGTGTRR